MVMVFKCKDKCGSCCGIVPIPLRVFWNNKDKWQRKPRQIFAVHNRVGKRSIIAETDDGYCIFLGKVLRDCKIYADRPVVCVAYGVSVELPCPYFRPDGTEWTESEKYIIAVKVTQLREKVLRVIDDGTGRTIHIGRPEQGEKISGTDEPGTEQRNKHEQGRDSGTQDS